MLRLLAYLLGILALASGLAWLAERPGTIIVNWQGYEGEIGVFHAVVAVTLLIGAAFLAWAVLRQLWLSPASVGQFFARRRQRRGLDAISSGMIAVGAGDRAGATRHALAARKSLPNEPLTHLLRAQAAQLSGDKATARRIFEAMLSSPDTEQLGLRGLFLEATRIGEVEAARQFAERALRLNPRLGWAPEALFDMQCKHKDWAGALQTLASARRYGQIDKTVADRRRAVLLTAQAQAKEDADPETALTLATEAHGLAPDLVPAAAIAGRILASRGHTGRAAKVIQRTWTKAPHPDLAVAYAYARIGDSPRDRLDRVRQLSTLYPNSIESPIAVAVAAIEARQFDVARRELEPLLADRLTQRVATLMARIESEDGGNKGRVREWLARAVTAERDPAWTADGVVSNEWAPISPVTGALDAFQWRVPIERAAGDGETLAHRLDDLIAIGAPDEAHVESVEERAPDTIDVVTPAADVVEAEPDREIAPAATGGRTHAPAAIGPSAAPASTPSAAGPADVAGPSAAAPAGPRERTAKAGPGADAATKASPTSSKRKAEPKIFVPPHAPDDPGPDEATEEDVGAPLKPYRATP